MSDSDEKPIISLDSDNCATPEQKLLVDHGSSDDGVSPQVNPGRSEHDADPKLGNNHEFDESNEKLEGSLRARKVQGHNHHGGRRPAREMRADLGLEKDDVYFQVRSIFRNVCREMGIRNKRTVGPRKWEEAKAYLIQASPQLQAVLAATDKAGEISKMKTLDIICGEVLSDMAARDKQRLSRLAERTFKTRVEVEDPDLLVDFDHTQRFELSQQRFELSQPVQAMPGELTAAPRSTLAVYFRLHPNSVYNPGMRVWIGTLTTRSFEELRRVAARGLAGAVVCGVVEGILDGGVRIEIRRDDELVAYLNTLGATGPPTFMVSFLPSEEYV